MGGNEYRKWIVLLGTTLKTEHVKMDFFLIDKVKIVMYLI